MYSLVIKEKTGIVGGWLEVDGEEYVIDFGDYEDEYEWAAETQAIWSDWMDKEIDSVQDIANGKGDRVSFKPCLVESIALVYKRG